jgi:hypothetical protein
MTEDGLHHLSRVPLADRKIAEDYLQESLHVAPELLPVGEIDPAFAPLVSLGREIDDIDNLFISPNGRITLVETKLWRNPQATREVVAQVLDYATRLSHLSYSGLEDAVRKALRPAPVGDESLYEYVAARHPDATLPEAQFIDEVGKTLSNARFLLLIVGDGIRQNLEQMLAHLHRHPEMLFTFALVEVQIYEAPELPGRLLIPSVVAQTTEVVRAVVRVETTGEAKVSVEIDETDEPENVGRRKLTEDIFFSELTDERTRQLFSDLLAFSLQLGAVPGWRSSGVSIQLPDPGGSGRPLTLFVMTTSGAIYTGWLAGQLERVGLDGSLAFEYVESLASLFPGLTPHRNNAGELSRFVRTPEVESKLDAFKELVSRTVQSIEDASANASATAMVTE